jgi:hypothetical protein
VPIADAHRYLVNQFPAVQGWCLPHVWQSIQPLYEMMAEEGPVRPVAEIGVFQGKFFIGLVLTVGASANNYAIDVFDLQQFNLDGAGQGDLQALRNNLEQSAIPFDAVQIHQQDSMTISAEDIAVVNRKVGGFSFFSVDACHMVEHTVNDINLAQQLTAATGIIFVDDYNNPFWPGVQEGVAKMYMTSSPRFIPLLFTSGKLFLCHISYHAKYMDRVSRFVKECFPETELKLVRRYGYDSLTIRPNFTAATYVKL